MKTYKPIRVAMIIQSYLPLIGGAERQIASLAPLLKELNVEIHIITRKYSGLKAFEVINGVFVHRIAVVGPKALAAIMYIFGSLYKIKKLKPDLLHAHELLSPSTIGVFGKWLFKLPVLAKVLRGGEIGDISKIKNGIFSSLRINFLIKKISAFAVISKEIDEELKDLNISNTKRIFLPNGVDTKRFKPISVQEKKELRKKIGLPSGKIVIYCGRLQPEKRVDQLIAAWNQIDHERAEEFLLIVGKGTEEQRLRQMAGTSVIFIGEVNDVLPYLNSSDIFVLPSSNEGLSNSLLEAMSCGLPIVATNVGGTTDLIQHNHSGLLISPTKSSEIQNSLLGLLKDDGTCIRLGINAREFVVQNYALLRMAERMRNTYDNLLESNVPFLHP